MLHGAYVLRTIAPNAIAVSSVWHSLNPKQSLIVMTQQTSRSGQLQRYEEELRHLEQELARIQMVPGRTYDLRNRAVARIVSNLSASAIQSTWAQALPQPQNNLASMWSTGDVELSLARWPATDKRGIFSLDEGSDEEMKRENNPAWRDYSRNNIVARHKETPWKSDIAQIGWNSKDPRSTKGNAYSHQTYVCQASQVW